MSTPPAEVAAARRSATELIRAVAALQPHYKDSVDFQRLRADAERVLADLDLLAGPAPAGAADNPVVLVPDTNYPESFFEDAEDEGIGGHH